MKKALQLLVLSLSLGVALHSSAWAVALNCHTSCSGNYHTATFADCCALLNASGCCRATFDVSPGALGICPTPPACQP